MSDQIEHEQNYHIKVSGTQYEIDKVLDGLAPRQRLEAMLEKLAAQAAADLWQPFEEQE